MAGGVAFFQYGFIFTNLGLPDVRDDLAGRLLNFSRQARIQIPMNTRQFYIDGAWVNPLAGTELDVINPSNETVCATISLGGEADTQAAVEAARRAFDSWSESSKSQRLELMNRILEVYVSRSGEIAEAISQEMGAPVDMAASSQVGTGSYHIKAFIRALEAFEFERELRPNTPNDRILYQPIGVCGLITPWNWPMNQIALKVMPALASGCTMVLKPSELSPLSAMVFADILHEAGVPAGVFNLLNGDGAGVGTALSGHRDVAMISFTGSSRAGIAISKNAADGLKRVSLELGGKGANIVFADAAAEAVRDGVARCFNNTGQSCNAPTRMLVERSRYDEAVAQAKEQADNTAVDLAEKHGSHIGPLVSQMQYDKVQALIERGISDDGARLVAGGLGKPEGLETGYFVRPTVFADCNNDMAIMREEIFGPVLSMMPFDTEEEAIAIANDTDYGLTNYVQTGDAARANRLARRLRSGMVDMNGQARSSGAPFGGFKHSGNGREGGVWGLEEFLEVKAVGGWSSEIPEDSH
ncbi:3-succinoylsemialdehyde-pyridine dehydrogenase [Granulosicoccus antarcticus IMCC3135]|uniref:aldehyde dehydrogenase (NAD(+)) n=2 Tax=Granulosicoccus TaxID=437504 RepID=A0A2Z2NPH3_9GAMM|nr:3-succinoylsemialdehyde-pyridine dehydrogenase [Granulosicoccus antarcticus IMCC3135]